jgi:hypothetical protein
VDGGGFDLSTNSQGYPAVCRVHSTLQVPDTAQALQYNDVSLATGGATMSLQPVPALYTVEDYLALERASEERHE